MAAYPWRNLTPSRRAALVFGAGALLLAAVLLFAAKPWQAAPAGRDWRIIDYVRIYSWWAGAINCLLLAALAATSRRWMVPSTRGLYDFPAPPMRRSFVLLTISAMALSAWFGAHRLRQSFWDDEVYAMRRAIHGQWKRAEDGSIRFRPVKWHETIWFFEKPQHVLHSVITRAWLDGWRKIAKPKGLQFREDIARMPSFLAGILSIGAVAILLWRLGYPAAGNIAAFLMAVHPWHIRYASELRAYSLMLLILPLAYVALIGALASGRWRWWVLYAALLLALMYSNALNIYPAAGLGLCGLGAILWRRRDAEAAVQAARFCVASLLAAMVFLQLMLPCLPQFTNYLRTTAVQGELDARWLASYLSFLFAGAPWSSTGQPVSQYVELYPRFLSHPWVFAGAIGVALLLAAVGARRLFAAGPVQAFVALALLVPAPAAYLISRLRHHHLFEWYLLFLLPGLVAAAAMGIDSWRRALSVNTTGFLGGIVLAIVLVGGYAGFTTPQRHWLTSRPLQQIRESVQMTRPTLDPHAKENQAILTASFIGPPDPYDANILRPDSLEKFVEIVDRAEAERKPLFVNFGFLQEAQLRFPAILRILNEPSLFEKVAELQGFEPINNRYIYRYKAGSAKGRNLLEEYAAQQNAGAAGSLPNDEE